MIKAQVAARGLALVAFLGLLTVGCRGNNPLNFDMGHDAAPLPDAAVDAVAAECETPADCPEDDNPCTDAPDCVDGSCVEAVSAADTTCDDGAYCNGADTCDGAGGCTLHVGDPCVSGDVCNNTCDEATDTCFSPVDAACDDGLFCNGADTCDGAGVCTHAGSSCAEDCDETNDNCPACGDGIVGAGEQCDPGAPASQGCCDPATCQWAGQGAVDPQGVCAAAADCQTSVCDGSGGCQIQNDPDGDPCTDNGQFCDGVETCQAGACVSPGDPCAGGGVCNNLCNEAADTCVAPASTVCRPAAGVCDMAEMCDGVNSTCPADTLIGVGTVCRAAVDVCDGAEACDGMSPACPVNAFQPVGTTCDDGAFCTGADTCDGAGACGNHAGDPCAAGDACNNTCNEGAGTCFSPVAAFCDDGVFCNGADSCDGAGACSAHAGDPCPGSCDETNDICAACGDGSVGPGEQCDPTAPSNPNCCDPASCQWTVAGVTDPQSVCSGAPECQLDVCNGSGGCTVQNVTNGAPCSDNGQFCDGVEACQAGTCTSPGDPCPAGDSCNVCNETSDTCFASAGVACDDGAFCTGTDTCDGAGACGNHTGDPCTAGDVCNNTCNESTDDCFSPAITACDDGAFCTGADTCDGAGACGNHTGDPCTAGDVCNNTCNESTDDCFSPAITACDDGAFCTGSDTCDGAGACGNHTGDPCAGGGVCNNTCNEPTDDCISPVTVQCRPSTQACDPAEFCDGVNAFCPADVITCAEAICDDNIDNDSDGDTDCVDIDCAVDPACLYCVEADLGNGTGTPVLLDGTGGFTDDYGLSSNCGPYASPGVGADVVYLWTPTQGGCYQLDTNGSSHSDPVLRIWTGCDGVELHCDDDSGDAGLDAELLFLATAGTPYFLIVDGYSGSEGDFNLNIQRLGDDTHPFCACPSQDLGTATGASLASGNSNGMGNTYPSSLACGAMSTSAEDVTFTWTAPLDGCYQLDTEGSNYNTILRMFPSCTSHEEIDCDDDSGASGNALIERTFTAGESVTLVVDGYDETESGNYDLNIVRLGAVCNEVGLCSDGIDNDGDGDTDCADSECLVEPHCTETGAECTDGVDNDGDGDTDCADPDCATELACLPPGSVCADAIDVTGGPFPYQVTGTFTEELDAGGSCDTTPHSMVFFRYTAPATDWYQIDVENFTTTNAYSRLAVFETTACSPYGNELACVSSSAKTASVSSIQLIAGQDYLIVFYTDGDTYTMVDPEISIAPVPPPPAGASCPTAIDVTGGPFPYQVTGTFEFELTAGGSCDTTPDNMVFFIFDPPANDTYTITAENFTTTNAYCRLAVFETTACDPYGTEEACETSTGKTVSATLNLRANRIYLIAFYTDGDTYTMVDPQITITP